LVVGVARREDLLARTAEEMRRSSPRSETRRCDVSDTDAFVALLHDAESRFGRIDVLVNNAGIEERTPVTDGAAPLETYRVILATNFLAAVAGTLAVLPAMTARRSGIVVNVSSDSARAPEPRAGAYAASKAALSAFTESVAHEVAGRGVHAHVLYPGWVPTAMGMSGIGEGTSLPPKPVRRTEAEVSALVLERMGGPRMEINAARLPLLAPIGRTLLPRAYQRAMRRFSERG
jgi:short-subunit dehydrogenase